LHVYWIKELRSLFRDRNIKVYGLLLPVFLYPGLLFGLGQIKLYLEGRRDATRPAVAVVGDQALYDFLAERGPSLRLQSLPGDAAELLPAGSIDLVVTPIRDGEALRVDHDSARGSSLLALQRVRPLLTEYGREVEIRQGLALGLSRRQLEGIEVKVEDATDPERATRWLLATILPLVLVVMCTFGATYPAVDLTAGERERRTVETTALLPMSRGQIALGKCLAVGAAAFLALLVNLGAMLLSAGPMVAGFEGGPAALPGLAWECLPLIVCFGLLLSIVFANLFLLVGSYARNYREAQAYVTPLQVVVMAPALLTLLPGSELNPMTALIPVYNAALAFRAALLGEVQPLPVLLSLASLGLFSLLCFRAAVQRLSDTRFVLGFHDPDQLAGTKA
jgi:ABC-type Na+ efflux pump permease subunit